MVSVKYTAKAALHDPGYVCAAVAGRLQRRAAEWQLLHDLRWGWRSRRGVFARIYNDHSWGSAESGSGTGSELRATGELRQRLPEMLSRLGATALLDAPCGDWNWMRHVDLPVDRYYGIDIVPEVIAADQARFGGQGREFRAGDLTRDALPAADVILCRDCLVHLSFQDASKVLENFRATGATWLLMNTYPDVQENRNQFTGKRWRHLNLLQPPFCFPEPVEMVPDGGAVDPNQLGLWALQTLPRIGDSAVHAAR